ncbi:ATP-binding protein [Paenibacillus sp. JSM ZJ436]|uniref:ATP-binding protein n=1 Tax=Paenibacillus sp. JSM ZJ436 TaxID=3376190 RepID=UPI0037A1F438
MIPRKWLTLMIGLTLVVVIPLYSGIRFDLKAGMTPSAMEGVLDLQEWDFAEDGAVPLKGEWEFYRGRLLNPPDFENPGPGVEHGGQGSLEPSAIVKLPGAWNSYISQEGEAESAWGYGTYRLIIQVPDGEENALYGIKTGNIRTANRIFLNGHQIGSSGEPAASREQETASNIPYLSFGPQQAGQIELVVQVSNYAYSSGGIFTSIWFGDVESILQARELSLFLDIMTLAGFLLPGAYALMLYRLRKERALLYLGLACTAMLIYTATHGEKLLAALFPGLGYEWFTKIQMMSSALLYYFLIYYVAVSLPGIIHRYALRAIQMLTAASLLTAWLTPVRVFSQLESIIFMTSLVSVLYMFCRMIVSIKGRSEEFGLQVIGVVSILMLIVMNIASLLGSQHFQTFGSLELVLFVLTQAILLARRFSDSFEEVQYLSRRLLTLDGLKDEFLANTSHELRTPLHGMVNISQSLVDGASGPLTPKQTADLRLIVSTGKRLSSLINDILDFNKLRNNQITLQPKLVDLSAVTTSVLEVMAHVSGNKQLVLRQELPERLPLLYADEERLRQVLYNLVGNAVKFSDQGQIIVTAQQDEEDWITVSVRDTGIGIEEQRLALIFQSYEQLEQEGRGDHQGTGLGLSITKKLVELGGGRLWVRSKPGEGSTFSFTVRSTREESLPVPEPVREYPGQEMLETEPDREQAGTAAARILVVDDDPVNLKVIHNLLGGRGIRILTASSGEEAWRMLSTGEAVDLVITDWMMPGMSGPALCSRIRERFTLFQLPVLILTARSLPEDVKVGLQAGANDFLRKPVDADELKSRVRTLLELRKTVRQAIASELAFLQAQIKPHFLFNALNTIMSHLPDHPSLANQLLLELARYLRRSFDLEGREQLTTLGHELELVTSYLNLEKARFEERLHVEYRLAAGSQLLVPPLSIQPIVENAVRHGLMRKEGGGTLVLEITESKEAVQITVSDNGTGMPQSRLSSLLRDGGSQGIGLRNIHSRLLSMFGSGLKLESAEGQGTTVSFEVPKHRG